MIKILKAKMAKTCVVLLAVIMVLGGLSGARPARAAFNTASQEKNGAVLRKIMVEDKSSDQRIMPAGL
ncbi:MAG: hypothetical protein LBS45_00945 [Synergistaceae bacterium]|jgi:hypothetical protein|nr:hypothetical protein [Synergistaceae bacterium]